MTANRAQRRAMKGKADATAAKLASRCYDFEGGGIVPVTDARAIAALTRAFALMLRCGGKPVALPLSRAEAEGFPRYRNASLSGGVSWLAVGLDRDRRASYALQTAAAAGAGMAHDAARALALARLSELCATSGFPMAAPMGRA